MKRYFLLLLVILLVSCTPRLHEVKETREMMGTIVTITVHDSDKDLANEAIDEAFSEITRIENLLSSYKEDSEVSILNKEKVINNPSEDLLLNIGLSNFYGEVSSGAFDITVQPILDLYQESFSIEQRPPTDEEIKEELGKVDYEKVRIEKSEKGDLVSIGNNQKITLGGIAKGYAVDKAIEVLKEKGIENALVNAGGDMRTIGKKYNNLDWSIALANPRDKNDYITLIKLSDKAIVTSGDYERYFNENKSFHHIVDPRTGYSATELMSVTILAENAFDADAVSTSVFVLGKEKGLELIEGLENFEVLMITKDKEVIKSSGFD